MIEIDAKRARFGATDLGSHQTRMKHGNSGELPPRATISFLLTDSISEAPPP